MKIKIDKLQLEELRNLKNAIERLLDAYSKEEELTDKTFEDIGKEILKINSIGERRFKNMNGIRVIIASSTGVKLAIK